MRVLTQSLRSLALAAPLVAPLAAQTPSVSPAVPVVQPASTGFKVDFDNQDIRVVLSALAEAAGVNVTYSNLPEMRTTLHLTTPVPKEKLIDVMRDIAESNGLAMSDQGPVVRIGLPHGPESWAAQRQDVRLYTYRLKHGNAIQLAPVLMTLFSGTALGAASPPIPPAAENASPQSSTPVRMRFSMGDGQSGGQVVMTPGQVVMTPAPGANGASAPGVSQFLESFVNNLSGAEAAIAQVANAQAAEALSQVRIVAEETTNSLLVRATPGEWELIQQVLGTIDLRPLQVLIEATIVEVTRTKDLSTGVAANVTNARRGRRNPDIEGDLPSVADARDLVLQLTGGRGAIDFTAALNALASRGDLRVRSLPIIVGQNNKQAVLNVGASRPFVQVSQTVPNDPTGRVQTIQYLDVGTKLTITPRINADGYVNLEVAQTANSATNEIQFDAPVLSRREATTQVFLRDGQTTVLGGLADNVRERSRSGIPILRSLPIIGGLFGSTVHHDVQSELYVFLTPHIISEDVDIDRLRDVLEKKSHELRKEPLTPMFPPRPQPAPAPVPSPNDEVTPP